MSTKKSTYFDYLREREGVELLELEHGFVLYKVFPEGVYLQDIYIEPKYRLGGYGRKALQAVEGITRELGLSTVIGSVDCDTNGATNSLKAVLATGFELSHCNGNTIYLTKRLNNG